MGIIEAFAMENSCNYLLTLSETHATWDNFHCSANNSSSDMLVNMPGSRRTPVAEEWTGCGSWATSLDRVGEESFHAPAKTSWVTHSCAISSRWQPRPPDSAETQGSSVVERYPPCHRPRRIEWFAHKRRSFSKATCHDAAIHRPRQRQPFKNSLLLPRHCNRSRTVVDSSSSKFAIKFEVVCESERVSLERTRRVFFLFLFSFFVFSDRT